MQNLLTYSLYAFFALAAITLLLYIPRIVCWFGAFAKPEHPINEKQNKFAILVPARNEAVIIKQILNCFKEQTYDAKNFDVFVIVKEENDETIKICKEYGYNSFVAPDQTNKADALDACFKALLAKEDNDYDDYIVFDADTWLDKKCLEEFNNATATGRDIITAKKLVKNYSLPKENRGITSLTNGFLWTMMDQLGNKWKSKHGYRLMTITCGILFKKEVIEELKGFPFDQTLTEDMELMYHSALQGYTEYYAENAIIYMEEAPTMKVTNIRRNRWIQGYVGAKRLYSKRLRKAANSSKKKMEYYYLIGIYHGFVIYTVPLLFGVFSLVLATILFFSGSTLVVQALLNVLYAFTYTYLTLFVLGIFVIASDSKDIKTSFWQKVKLALYHPISYMRYTNVVLKALFGSHPTEWQQIERNVTEDEEIPETKKAD